MRTTSQQQRRKNADLLVESGTSASAPHQGEDEINISHRDEEMRLLELKGHMADMVTFPACIFQLHFNPYSLATKANTSLPAATKSVLCFRVPTQPCQIRAEVNLIRRNGWQRTHTHTQRHKRTHAYRGRHATTQTISHALKCEHMVGGGLQRHQPFDIFIKYRSTLGVN